ncbi:MAG: iron ABC transporter permease [Chlorobi bacterium]|nr:iron ABC transporter permease [Chlorobiota bacterium]
MKIKIFYAIIYVSFAVFIVLPLLYLFGLSFLSADSVSFDTRVFALLGKSILISASAAFFSTLAGVAAAFFIYKVNLPFSGVFKVILLIPLFLPPYVYAVLFEKMILFIGVNPAFMRSGYGLVIIDTFIFMPLSVLVTGSAVSGIKPEIEESALLFTGIKNTFFKIVLKLIKPSLTASFILVFIFSISEFSVPAFLGVKVFINEIFVMFSAFYEHSAAMLHSLFLVVLSVALPVADKKYFSDAPFFSFGIRKMKINAYGGIGLRLIAFLFLSGWLFISFLLPFFLLLRDALHGGIGEFFYTFKTLFPAFLNSFILSASGAVASIIAGFAVAYKTAFYRKKDAFDLMLLIVFAFPSIIFGIAFIKFYGNIFSYFFSGIFMITAAFAGKFTFIAFKIILNSIKQIPYSLREAAKLSGISEMSYIFKILMPQIIMPLTFAFMTVFILNFSESGAVMMIYPPGTDVLSVKVFTLSTNASQSTRSLLILLQILFTAMPVLFFYFLFLKIKSKIYIVNK